MSARKANSIYRQSRQLSDHSSLSPKAIFKVKKIRKREAHPSSSASSERDHSWVKYEGSNKFQRKDEGEHNAKHL